MITIRTGLCKGLSESSLGTQVIVMIFSGSGFNVDEILVGNI